MERLSAVALAEAESGNDKSFRLFQTSDLVGRKWWVEVSVRVERKFKFQLLRNCLNFY